MRKLTLTALLGIFAIAAFAADVSGTWTAQVPGRGGNMQNNTIVLKQSGGTVTGTLDGGRGGPVEIQDGKVDGDTVSFTVVRETQNGKFTAKYKGMVSGSEIKFTRTTEGGQGGAQPVEFTAKKSST